MRKLMGIICLGMFVVSQAHAATYTVGATGANYTDLAAAFAAATADGDIIQIIDSGTYTVAATLTFSQPNQQLVAAPGANPVITNNFAITASTMTVATSFPGCRIGSLSGGRITFDGNGTDRRLIAVYNPVANTAWSAGPTTTTIENIVIRNMATNSTATSCYPLYLLTEGALTACAQPNPVSGLVINVRYVDFQWPAGAPSVTLASGSTYQAIRYHGQGTLNIENCQTNTVTGYFLTAGYESSTRDSQAGTINIKNCRLLFNEAPLVDNNRMGAVIALWNTGATANPKGWTLNIDNSYLRNDAANSQIWTTGAVPGMTIPNLETQGVINLANYANNTVNITNSALVGKGAGIVINTNKAGITMSNSDIYVPTAAAVTPGYFIKVGGVFGTTSNNSSATLTRCNVFGVDGSNLQPGRLGPRAAFTMSQCNDWSTSGSYVTNWVPTGCLTPGQNPNYAAIATNDFTVGNAAVTTLGSGANRAFNMLVPVELSTFSVQ